MDGGGADSILMPSDALASIINNWVVGVRSSYPLVSLSSLCCAVTTGQRVYELRCCSAISFRTPVSPE